MNRAQRGRAHARPERRYDLPLPQLHPPVVIGAVADIAYRSRGAAAAAPHRSARAAEPQPVLQLLYYYSYRTRILRCRHLPVPLAS